MKPPICAICNDDFYTGGGLIYFPEDEQDVEHNKRFEQPGFVGHPSNAFWFCDKHIKIARKHSGLTKKEAFSEIYNELDLNTGVPPEEPNINTQ